MTTVHVAPVESPSAAASNGPRTGTLAESQLGAALQSLNHSVAWARSQGVHPHAIRALVEAAVEQIDDLARAAKRGRTS